MTRILIFHAGAGHQELAQRTVSTTGKLSFIQVDSWLSGKTMYRILEAADADGLLLHISDASVEYERQSLEEFLKVAEIFGAGLVYSDSRKIIGGDIIEHPKTDYQPGSIRDTFDFGPAVLVSKQAAEEALRKHGAIEKNIRWGGFYDLRLKISIDSPIVRVADALYVENVATGQPSKTANVSADATFRMPDRSHREYCVESEKIATAHLRRIGAYLEAGSSPPPISHDNFPVTASIIMPVRNRERTIADSIQSALRQSTTLAYNILIVDDHSTDRTAETVRQFARQHKNVVHIIPRRKDLGVGGLWNEAIYSEHCGRYALQLDSDDVYSHDGAVQKLMDEFKPSNSAGAASDSDAPRYAMVVGSYTFVNFDLKEIPPGVNQRLELSRENGRNNALCLEGPGAPRAFYVPVLRRIGFPNVSFGEDYAVALRIGRDYDIGRVFEPTYLARQWEGNTYRTLPLGSIKSINAEDILPAGINRQELLNRMRPIIAPLSITSGNRNNAYKDYLRTVEIHARRNRNQPV
ncbi:MAG: glycosyltransferase family 2 protein [Blastocatellia bacterium]